MSQPLSTDAAEADAADDAAEAAEAAAMAASARPRLPASTVAAAALILGIVALGLSVFVVLRPAAVSCQVAAWDAVPKAGEMPPGWTIGSTDIYRDSQTTRIAGPDTGDGSGPPTVYLNVTCFGDRAADVVDRSERSSRAALRAVTTLDGVGDAGYAIAGDVQGGSALHFRRGPLVAYLASSGLVTQAELAQVGWAVDAAARRSLGDAGATAPPFSGPSATPAGSGAIPGGASPEPSLAVASPIAPELEALMPRQVAGTPLVTESATADLIIGDDAASKALVSVLDSLGKKPADLQIAQAYDQTGQVDIAVLGFRLAGVSPATLQPAIMQTWLFSGATGVTTKKATVNGVDVTEISYGGSASVSYVVVRKDAVIVVQSGDPVVAGAVLSELP